MSPDLEAELLLGCARGQVTTGRAADIPSIAQKKIDWERLLRLAKRHGGIPILYQALSTTCPQVVPPTVLDHLRDQYQALVQHNHALTERLVALLGLLQAENRRLCLAALPSLPSRSRRTNLRLSSPDTLAASRCSPGHATPLEEVRAATKLGARVILTDEDPPDGRALVSWSSLDFDGGLAQ
jgi:hypothetical protein